MLSTDVAELIEDFPTLGKPSNQALVASTFDAIERTAPTAGMARAFVTLRRQLDSIADESTERQTYAAYRSATHDYVAALPAQIGRCFVIGAGIRRVYHNAVGARVAQTDVHDRILLGRLDDADALSPKFAELRQALAAFPIGDFANVASVSRQLLLSITAR